MQQEHLNQTLEELEGNCWPPPSAEASTLIIRCHRLRRKVLKDFTIEDLRVMIGQSVGLEYLIPIAIRSLKDNPFAEGDYYEGDLLQSVLDCPAHFWSKHIHLKTAMQEIIDETKRLINAEKGPEHGLKIVRKIEDFHKS